MGYYCEPGNKTLAEQHVTSSSVEGNTQCAVMYGLQQTICDSQVKLDPLAITHLDLVAHHQKLLVLNW
jgi:hypothetical protein